MAKITRYKVTYPSGTAEYGNEDVARKYGIDMGGDGEVEVVVHDVPDEHMPKASDIANAKRISALADKWPDAFDLLDDILQRGVEAVKLERDTIKNQNPKG